MKRIAVLLTVVLAAVGLWQGCSQGEKSVRLQFKFQTGDKLVYTQATKRHMRALVKDSVIDESMKSFTTTITQEVTATFDDGSALVKETDEWAYEAPNKDDTTVTDSVHNTMELSFKAAPSGKLLEIIFDSTEDVTTRSYVRDFYEQGLPVFPQESMSPGYVWTQTTKVLLDDEPMEASTTYKLTSLVRESGYDCAVIECDGTMILPLKVGPGDTTLLRGVDRIHTKGMTYFAYKEGFLVLQRERWTIDGDRSERRSGEEFRYKTAVEIDVDYRLRKHESAGEEAAE